MKHRLLLSAIFVLGFIQAFGGELDWTMGSWSAVMSSSGKLQLSKNGTVLLKNVYVKAKNANDEELSSNNYPTIKLAQETLTDELGTGKRFTYTYSGLSGKESIEQSFCVYENRDFIVTEASLVAASGQTRSCYIAPIVTTSTSTAVFLPSGGDCRMLDIPFDNDAWIGYTAQPFSLGQSVTSSEATCFYDVVGRKGLCIGSITHDTWKTGITASTTGSNKLRSLQVFSGYFSEDTRDIMRDSNGNITNQVLHHGYVSGQRVTSARIFIGFYDDWRDGMEQLGDATAALKPKLEWDKGTIFAWQSWGGMAEKVNYEGAVDVSDFFASDLMPAGFVNENGTCYMVLDSYWSNLSDSQLSQFVQRCKANGQHPGIYTTPFSYWGDMNTAKTQKPEGTDYTYDQLILRGNGEPRKITAYALDPTHPGTLAWNKNRLDKFKSLGFEYVKLDFLNNGTMEADSYYEPSVTTGMQAYTYGMTRILEMAKGMFVDLSIAPVFPAMGHARRISCDAWGERNFSQYVLNSLNLGWWLDRVYNYNDPDHLVLQRSEDDAAARMRYSCGAMTGTVLLGDNYSLKGTCLGKQEYRDRASRVATNKAINRVAQIGRSFRPVEGGQSANSFNLWNYSYNVDNEFQLTTDDAYYYVCFNFKTDSAISKKADFARLGIDAGDVKRVTELWTGTDVTFDQSGFAVSVPKGDVSFYRIDRVSSGIGKLEWDADQAGHSTHGSHTAWYSLSGQRLCPAVDPPSGIYVKCTVYEDGSRTAKKVAVR